MQHIVTSGLKFIKLHHSFISDKSKQCKTMSVQKKLKICFLVDRRLQARKII